MENMTHQKAVCSMLNSFYSKNSAGVCPDCICGHPSHCILEMPWLRVHLKTCSLEDVFWSISPRRERTLAVGRGFQFRAGGWCQNSETPVWLFQRLGLLQWQAFQGTVPCLSEWHLSWIVYMLGPEAVTGLLPQTVVESIFELISSKRNCLHLYWLYWIWKNFLNDVNSWRATRKGVCL